MKVSFVNNHDQKIRLFHTLQTKGKQGKYIGEIESKSDRQFDVSIGDIITVKSQRKVVKNLFIYFFFIPLVRTQVFVCFKITVFFYIDCL